MKIQIIQSIAGNEEPMYDLAEFSFAPGSIIEVHDVLGAAWVASGVAIEAKKADRVTIPSEAFTLRRPAPAVAAETTVDE